jgi:hypothetical protein
MFFLFEVINQNLFLGFIPESIGLLIFGIGLVLLTIGLRWIMKRGEKSAEKEIKHITEQGSR